MEKITLEKNQSYVGKEISVLAERHVLYGKSRELKLVKFLGVPEEVGNILPITISLAFEWLLEGSRAV